MHDQHVSKQVPGLQNNAGSKHAYSCFLFSAKSWFRRLSALAAARSAARRCDCCIFVSYASPNSWVDAWVDAVCVGAFVAKPASFRLSACGWPGAAHRMVSRQHTAAHSMVGRQHSMVSTQHTAAQLQHSALRIGYSCSRDHILGVGVARQGRTCRVCWQNITKTLATPWHAQHAAWRDACSPLSTCQRQRQCHCHTLHAMADQLLESDGGLLLCTAPQKGKRTTYVRPLGSLGLARGA